MLKRRYVLLLIGSLFTLLLVACGSTQADPSTSVNQVHMDDTSFLRLSISIKKGEVVTLISDTLISHTIANGTWNGGNSLAAKEPGAPEVNNVSVGGNSTVHIGPFPTPGRFKLYCTIHPGMNLIVKVQ